MSAVRRPNLINIAFGFVAAFAAASPVFAANNWVNLPAISPTTSLSAGHLCYTDGRDLACNTVTPYITSGGLIGIGIVPVVQLEVSGTISATHLVGDGSGITGITAANISGLANDRIISGSTSMVANSGTNVISITTSGVNTGYFNSNGVLIVPGISATANLTSITTLYASGKVGIGTGAPAALLSIANGANDPVNYGKALQIINLDGNRQQVAFVRNGSNVLSAGYNGASPVWGFGAGSSTDSSFIPNWFNIDQSTGYVGIGTVTPTQLLAVNGNLTLGNGGGYILFRNNANTADQAAMAVNNSDNILYMYSRGTGWQVRNASNTVVLIHATDSGNVGIGTSSPNAKLEVNGQSLSGGDATYRGDIALVGNSGGAQSLSQNGGLEFKSANAGSGFGWRVMAPDLGSGNTPLVFQHRANAVGWTEDMRITNSGNVGIGATNPSNKLEVNTGVSQSTTGVVFIGSDNHNLLIRPSSPNGGANGLVLGGDISMIFTNNSVDTGRLVIGPWSTGARGLVIRGDADYAGFGVVTPTANLEVSGTVSATRFVGDGSGLSGISTQGDRIVSGSLLAVANSATGYISLTTNGTNWGYLNSVVSYLPNVSTTNGQVSNLLTFGGQAITSLVGGGGNSIVSGTSSVSVTNASSGAINLATNGSLRMSIVSSGNVGIGTAIPRAQLHLTGTIISDNYNDTLVANAYNASGWKYTSNGPAWNIGGYSGDSTVFRILTAASGTAGSAVNWRTTVGIDAANGNVGIGTTAPTYKISAVAGSDYWSGSFQGAAGSNRLLVGTNAGVATIGANNDAGSAWTQLNVYGSSVNVQNLSDIRLKRGIHDLPSGAGLAAITKLRPVVYHWRDVEQDKLEGEKIGLIAQDVQKVFPQFVKRVSGTTITLADGSHQRISTTLTLNYNGFIVPLIKSVQELKAQNDNLRSQIQELRNEIREMNQRKSVM